MLAAPAAFLRLITDLPNPAPDCDICLNMPELKSTTEPRSDNFMPNTETPSNPESAFWNPSTLLPAPINILPVSITPFTIAIGRSLRLVVAFLPASVSELPNFLTEPVALVVARVSFFSASMALSVVAASDLDRTFSFTSWSSVCLRILYVCSASSLSFLPSFLNILNVDSITRDSDFMSSPRSRSILSSSSAIRV